MRYGICQLSIVPMRAEPSDPSELVNQVLYGEHFKVVEQRKQWSRIKLSHDKYEGWIDNKQYVEISEEEYAFAKAQQTTLTTDPVQFITTEHNQLLTVVLGSSVENIALLKDSYDGNSHTGKTSRTQLVETALLYLKTPYLWGGRTTFGIDCSGFTQMVYRLNGFDLKRDASQQATQGEALSFIEESEPGDLAFFDNAEGLITHVGIIMEDNYIIHAHGEVRIDRLDHSGIYNVHKGVHTHKLRVIKKII
ncbi:C40 family peptidase [uncultured Dokdonia sp.]|jgi:cell wall-associated NlpC family hydrolase|uniref:C40 family peptidase n=1 Tax=uncultured Dokdonia sp. TaxID=575653 RepID=UPI0030EC1D5B